MSVLFTTLEACLKSALATCLGQLIVCAPDFQVRGARALVQFDLIRNTEVASPCTFVIVLDLFIR